MNDRLDRKWLQIIVAACCQPPVMYIGRVAPPVHDTERVWVWREAARAFEAAGSVGHSFSWEGGYRAINTAYIVQSWLDRAQRAYRF